MRLMLAFLLVFALLACRQEPEQPKISKEKLDQYDQDCRRNKDKDGFERMKACIAHAQATQAGILNLSHLGLEMDSIPPEISKLSELGTLDLQGNKIKAIPPDIGKLKNLKH